PHAVLRQRGGLAINLGRPVRGAVRVPVVRIPAAQGERMTSSPELAALFQWDRPPGLLGWAFRPRNFMKNPPKRINREQRANRRRGFSTLSCAFAEPQPEGGDRPGGLSYSGSARTFLSTGSRAAISTPRGAVFRSAKRRALTITRLSSDPTALL